MEVLKGKLIPINGKNKVETTRIIDKYNNRKVWLVKHYADGHYTVNQEIDSHILYSRFQRMTKMQLEAILNEERK